jgi:hypothetical protein
MEEGKREMVMTQYQQDLIRYVIANSNIMHEVAAMEWLDMHAPKWRQDNE